MQADGLTPIAFGDKDGWPAMGTFDILNLRLNGYDFHVGLMAGTEKWTDPKVTAVFEKWKEILPFHAKDYAGLDLAGRGEHAVAKKSGMYLLGTVRVRCSSRDEARPTSTTSTSSRSRRSGTSFDAEAALDAPIDTWQIAAKAPNLEAERDTAKAYLEFWAKGSTQGIIFQNQPGVLPTAKDSDTSTYTDAPEEGRRDRQQGQAHHPVPRPRHAPGLRGPRTACSASSRRSSPSRTRTWPGLSEVHPGLLGLSSRRSVTSTIGLS